MFVDDLLLFSKASTKSARGLTTFFADFSKVSGLHINQQKSSVFFGGVGDVLQAEFLGCLTMSVGSLPVKYLSVPLSGKRLQAAQYQPLLDRILALLQKYWSNKFLSYAG